MSSTSVVDYAAIFGMLVLKWMTPPREKVHTPCCTPHLLRVVNAGLSVAEAYKLEVAVATLGDVEIGYTANVAQDALDGPQMDLCIWLRTTPPVTP